MVKVLKNGEFENTKNRAIIVVPESISHDYERFLCEKYGNEVCKTIEVLTFSRLCKRIFEKIGGFSNTYLNDAGRILAVYKAINQNQMSLKIFSAKKPDIAHHLLNIIDEFKVQAITEADIARIYEASDGKLKNKMHDLFLIYTSYNLITCGENLDPRNEFQFLIDNFYKTDYFDDFLFYFDGFDMFTPMQMQFIDELLAKNIDITMNFEFFDDDSKLNSTVVTTINKIKHLCVNSTIKLGIVEKKMENNQFLPYINALIENKTPEISNNIFLHTSENMYNECFNVASNIIEIYDECRKNGIDIKLDDFVITSRNFDSYKDQLEVVFSRIGLPIYISNKQNIASTYPIKFIFATFDAILSSFKNSAILKFMKNPIFGDVAQVNEFENYITRWNIKYITKNKKFMANPSFKMKKNSEDDLEKLEKLNNFKDEKLADLFLLNDKLKKCSKAVEYAECLYEFYEKMNLPLKILNVSTTNLKIKQQFDQLWDVLVDSLEQFAKIYTDENLDLGQFISLYKNVISSYVLDTIPSSVTSVYASEFESVKKCKYLFILGANSDDLPKISSENKILTNADKIFLKENDLNIGEFGISLNRYENELIHKTLLRASDGLYISYSLVKSDKVLPSEIFRKSLKFIDINKVSTDKSKKYSFFYKNRSTALENYALNNDFDSVTSIDASFFTDLTQQNKIKQEFVEDIYPKDLSPTQINMYNTCKFSYFLRYILKIDDDSKLSFDNLQNGNFIHSILEKYIEKLMKQEQFWIYDDSGFKVDICDIQMKIDDLALEIKSLGTSKKNSEVVLENKDKMQFYIDKKDEFMIKVEEKLTYIKSDINIYIEDYFTRNFATNLSHDYKSKFDLDRAFETTHLLIANTIKEIYLSNFKPKYCELSTDDSKLEYKINVNDFEFSIRGKIDRIDSNFSDNLQVKIIDYKSGSTQYDITKIANGLEMQMLIYAIILQKTNFAEVMSVMYSHAVLPKINAKTPDIEKEISDAMKRSGVTKTNNSTLNTLEDSLLINQISSQKQFRTKDNLSKRGYDNLLDTVNDNLNNTIKSIISGDVSVDPFNYNSKTPCDYCTFMNVCGFNEEYDKFRKFEKVDTSKFEAEDEVDD